MWIFLLIGALASAADPAVLTVEEVIRAALARAPETVQAGSDVLAATGERQEVATLLNNPEVQVGVGALGSRVQGTLNQPFSLAGEGWHARRAAVAGIDEADANAARAGLIVAAQARASYARAITARLRWALLDEALAQAGRMRGAVERLAEAGETSPLDVQLARLAEAEAAAAAVEARREELAARVALATLAPEASSRPLSPSPDVVVPAGRAPAERSDVSAAAARLEEAQAELSRARAAAVPPLGLGLFYEQEPGTAGAVILGPQVSWDLPLWWRNQAGVAAARGALDVARAGLDRLTARAEAERAGTAEVADYADTVVERLGDFEAEGRSALEAIEAGWTQGDLGLADAVLLRRSVLAGWSSALQARQSAVEARLDAMLASEDSRLLPATAPEPDRRQP
jgi:outer membrane protein TolC